MTDVSWTKKIHALCCGFGKNNALTYTNIPRRSELAVLNSILDISISKTDISRWMLLKGS